MATATKLYHVGTVRGAPWGAIALGGVCFPQATYEPRGGVDGIGQALGRAGDYIDLHDEDVKRVRAAMANRVVRIREERNRDGNAEGVVWHLKHRRYRADPRDVPIASFVYLREATEAERAATPLLALPRAPDGPDDGADAAARTAERRAGLRAPQHQLDG